MEHRYGSKKADKMLAFAANDGRSTCESHRGEMALQTSEESREGEMQKLNVLLMRVKKRKESGEDGNLQRHLLDAVEENGDDHFFAKSGYRRRRRRR
jgi:hypothetical protein